MKYHSNQTSWYESIADVVVLKPNADFLVDPVTPYPELTRIMHENGVVCFVDFAASTSYIDMHPKDELQKLDAGIVAFNIVGCRYYKDS